MPQAPVQRDALVIKSPRLLVVAALKGYAGQALKDGRDTQCVSSFSTQQQAFVIILGRTLILSLLKRHSTQSLERGSSTLRISKVSIQLQAFYIDCPLTL